MSAAQFSTDELRAAVRAVLRDVLPAEIAGSGVAVGGAAPLQHVAVGSDAELDALVRRVAALCEDPSHRAALREGRHGFRLVSHGSATPDRARGVRETAVHGGGVVRVERGAVTERTVARAAADGARLVVGRKAVLTPLARDKARNLGVEIEKER